MCGIVGYKSKNNLKIDKNKLVKSILHRGPDSQNFFEIKKGNQIENSIFLGFTRLAILDRKNRSNQPFSFKNLVLCFNGEIYNFIKLKNELIKNFNIKFETNSDTEVLIKLIFYYSPLKCNDQKKRKYKNYYFSDICFSSLLIKRF